MNLALSTRQSPRSDTQYEFIDLCLLYEGRISNSRIRNRFGVSNVQASRIIAAYRDAFPNNLISDAIKGRGYYQIGHAFRSHASDESIWTYLRTSRELEHIVTLNPVTDLTSISPQIFRVIHEAAAQQIGVIIVYCSMNHPQGIERTIYPHTITFIGRRWHVRGFDEKTGEFRDFNLGRISEATLTDTKPPLYERDDLDWQTEVSITLMAHPDLSPEHQKLIRNELFRSAGARIIKCRGALVKYMVRELEAAIDIKLQKPPEYQIFVGNLELIKNWLFD
jgi:predicted DNA-binding transcriptional regulator YafY